MAAHPLPADEVYWDAAKQLQRRNEAILREVLEEASSNDPKRSAVQREIGDYYASCMDDKRSETAGLRPIKAELDRIASVKNKHSFASELAHLHQILLMSVNGWAAASVWDPGSYEPLFGFFRLQDFDDASKVVAIADQGGLGLPDRDYYLKEDEQSVQLRKQYVQHIGRTLELAGTPNPSQAASRVLAIETALARHWMDVVNRRDLHHMNHKFSFQQLQELMPSFEWKDYVHTLDIPLSEHYLITAPEFFVEANKLLETVSLEDWKTYLRWHLLRAASPTLSSTFVSEDFDFYSKTLLGQHSQPDRWKLCLQAADRDLGEALGQEFISRSFREGDKQEVLNIAEALDKSFGEDIQILDWMTPATKQEALAKLGRIKNRIGYPEKWQDYSTVRISRDDWTGNVFRASEFALTWKLKQIGKPVNRAEWVTTPPSTNAYSHPQQNNITVPAGFLAPPYYDGRMDAAVNFGGIGAVIGHELTHEFDDAGRTFDRHGNLYDWWTPADSKRFTERAKCVADQYSQYIATGDVRVNGDLTLSENLADAAGLRIAYMAMKHSEEEGKTENSKIDGFSPEQRFFLSYGLSWCSNITPEMLRERASNNPHSPPRFRVNGVVSNMPEFQQAFGCQKGQPMVRENACRVW